MIAAGDLRELLKLRFLNDAAYSKLVVAIVDLRLLICGIGPWQVDAVRGGAYVVFFVAGDSLRAEMKEIGRPSTCSRPFRQRGPFSNSILTRRSCWLSQMRLAHRYAQIGTKPVVSL
jgi:hypothetical protein